MNGTFGVFCGVDLIGGTFGNDDDADLYMRTLVEVGEYDAVHLEVAPVPEDYEVWYRLLEKLQQSKKRDQVVERLRRLREEAEDDSARV